MSADVDALKRVCPMPALLHRMGLGEFAKNNCRSPFRRDKRPSWGIFKRDGKWFFKDQATGDSGDELTLLARWKGLDAKRDFQELLRLYAELAGIPFTKGVKPFPWSTCVSAFTPTKAETLAQWRGYSPEFCGWLKSENLMGLHDGNWALPVHGEAGAVIGTHYRVDRGKGEKADWFYHPKGIGWRALVFGDPKRAANGFVFESPWDAFGVMNKLGWHKPKEILDTSIVITRGASNGKLVAGLFTHETTVYAFKQNDTTKNSRNPADEWLADVCAHAGCKVLHVATPAQFKDVNDWLRAGATGVDIMSAIQEAKFVEAIPPDTESAAPVARWPKPLEAAALHGVAGEVVKRLDPHTEADPAAILFQLLVGFGNLTGPTVYFAVEAQLRKAVAFAETCGELRRDSEARELWRDVYHDLSASKPGLFGAVISRAEAYVVRLSLVYATLDFSQYIRRDHLEAALAAWRYCEDSARYIFGESLGDPDADAILAALREAGATGLTRTEITEHVFKRHRTKTEIDRALNVLAECALAESKADPTEGRAAEKWSAK